MRPALEALVDLAGVGTCTAPSNGEACSTAAYEAKALGGAGLTPELVAELLGRFRRGYRVPTVLALFEVAQSTYRGWITRGEAHVVIFLAGRADSLTLEAKLALGVKRSLAEFETDLLDGILADADAALRWKVLKTRFPAAYNPTVRVVNDEDARPPEKTASAVDVLARRLEQLDAAIIEVDREELAEFEPEPGVDE